MEELTKTKTISELASVSYVRKKEPLGLGHAIANDSRGCPVP